MEGQWKAAFIGCGQRARAHAAAVKADGRCKVVALSDLSREAAEKMRQDYGFAEAALYADHLEMLEREKPDVVISCLWTPLHLPIFRDCVRFGVKALLSEKPMAPTWGDCLEMARLAEQTGCQLTFCHQRRFAKGNRLARQLLAEGIFGDILRMDLYSPQNLLDCGTHTLDQAMSFNGESPVKWVLGAVDVSSLIKWFDVSAESMMSGTLVFENGVHATMRAGGPDLELQNGVRVYGTKGFFEVNWNGIFGRSVVYGDPGWTPPEIAHDSAEQMGGVVGNALDSLASGTEPELSYHKALRASEAIFAFYESVRRRARVELPLTDITDNPFLTMLENGEFPAASTV